MIATIAAQQVLSLRRQRIFLAFLGLFLTMTALAGVLGWSSHTTIVRVYNEAVKLLASNSKPAPPNPFLLKPKLSLLSNMVVYIPLLGAMLAIVIGHMSLADDEGLGLGRLIFSRPVSRYSYVAGKILGAGEVIAVITAVSFSVSAASISVVYHAIPTGGDVARLLLFYGLSWLYLMFFVFVGMATVLATRRRSLALLSAIGIWLVITFAVPQFTSGLRPTASLNPIIDPVPATQPFFQITALARPYSVAEQYKEVSARILATVTAEPIRQTTERVFPLVGLLLLSALLVLALAQRHDFSRSSSGE